MTGFLAIILWSVAAFIFAGLFAGRIAPKAGSIVERGIVAVLEIYDRQLKKQDRKNIKLEIVLSAAVFGVVGFIFVPTWPLKFIVLPAAMFLGLKLPELIAKRRLARRVKKFEEQFVDGLTLVSNAVRSGLSLQQAFEMASIEMPKPFSEELAYVLAETRLGSSLEDALQNMVRRIQTDDLKIVVQAIVILRETGGNIIETFQNLNATIRERQKVQGKIRVLTTQGVVQGTIIFCMPFALSLVLYFVSPDFIMPLFTKPLGWILIFAALVLQAVGAVFMKKIVMIKV